MILLGVSVALLILFLMLEEPDSINAFDSIVSEFSFIHDVRFYGNSPTLAIGFKIDESATVQDIDRAFLSARDIFQMRKFLLNLLASIVEDMEVSYHPYT